MPKEMENLLDIARIKILCKETGVFKVSQKLSNVVFNFDINLFNPEIVNKLVEEYKERIRFSQGVEPYITLRIKNESGKIILEEVKTFLKKLL
jgi:transcription-repair coupling factor (superfamily II helicase)